MISVTQESLLQAALAPPVDITCRGVVEMAASVGVMYLSTMAGALPAPALVMIATLLNDNRNLLMVENLIAAVWILLKHPDNRAVLGTAFAENPVLSATMKGQMQVCEHMGRPKSPRFTASSVVDTLPAARTRRGEGSFPHSPEPACRM
jgi:hypothetical protein